MKSEVDLIFNFFACMSIASSFAIHSVRRDKSGICKKGFCGSVSYKYLQKNFKGVFHSAEDIFIFDGVNNNVLKTPVMNSSPERSLSYGRADDGAICCSTRAQHLYKTEMVNIEGKKMSIFHMSDDTSPSFQYIPHAECVRTGRCPGTCVTEGKILSLLAFDPVIGMTFDFFEVPGYCSCKNIILS